LLRGCYNGAWACPQARWPQGSPRESPVIGQVSDGRDERLNRRARRNAASRSWRCVLVSGVL
jgi:hypothetical protein